MKWLLSLLVFSLAPFCGALHAQDSNLEDVQEELPALLLPKFELGKTYRFISTTDVYMTPPGESPRQIRIEQQARYDVDPLSGGRKGVALRGLTEKLKVDIQAGGKSVTYDSLEKGNQNTTIGRHFESTVNRYVKMELNERLKIMSHKEAGRSAGATPLPGLPRFGPEELVQIINAIPQGYSPDPVKTGDEWVLKGKRPVGDLGDLGFEISYKNLGLMKYEEHACIVIEFRGQMSGDITNDNSRNVEFQGSRINGSILFDPQLGMTRYSEHSVSMIVYIPDSETKEKRAVPMQQKAVLKLMQVKKK
ncbi:MAG: hypothetical protein P1U89_18360 [Verrucomicrobiales bacterium]|nr:hypothetical protein [Verrucomicrobiales bacterium]